MGDSPSTLRNKVEPIYIQSEDAPFMMEQHHRCDLENSAKGWIRIYHPFPVRVRYADDTIFMVEYQRTSIQRHNGMPVMHYGLRKLFPLPSTQTSYNNNIYEIPLMHNSIRTIDAVELVITSVDYLNRNVTLTNSDGRQVSRTFRELEHIDDINTRNAIILFNRYYPGTLASTMDYCDKVHVTVPVLMRPNDDVKGEECYAGIKHLFMHDDDQHCAICLDAIDDASETHDSLKILPCMHVFGSTCLRTWCRQNTTCPLCRCAVESLVSI